MSGHHAADPIDLINRLDYRRRTLPPDASCSCGTWWPILLHRWRSRILCYQCLLVARGGTGWELHHVGGDSSSVRVLVPGNVHRMLSIWQDLTWRGTFHPASHEAVISDVLGIAVLWRRPFLRCPR